MHVVTLWLTSTSSNLGTRCHTSFRYTETTDAKALPCWRPALAPHGCRRGVSGVPNQHEKAYFRYSGINEFLYASLTQVMDIGVALWGSDKGPITASKRFIFNEPINAYITCEDSKQKTADFSAKAKNTVELCNTSTVRAGHALSKFWVKAHESECRYASTIPEVVSAYGGNWKTLDMSRAVTSAYISQSTIRPSALLFPTPCIPASLLSVEGELFAKASHASNTRS